ncbi:peptidylprolyl isomerase [Thermodesulfovibrio sp.]|uniref:peptidylprolyl isomerase n=1 Tax=Thermodesulfovibrio sp. TaxID=2067987 RepID=UPI003096102A
MKKSFPKPLLLLFIFFSVQAFTFSISFAQDKFFVDRVLAVVNREVVTWSELYKYMEFISRDDIKNLSPDEKFKYFKQREEEFLERLIDTKLQIEEAERYGIFVSDSEIEAAINDIKKKYGLNDKEFEESLKKEGMTLSDYKKMMKEQIIIGRAVNSLVRSKIIITDSETNSYISSHPELSCEEEGYYVSQIFIKMRDNQEQVKEKISEAIKRLIQGESFSKVASQLSEDASARTGGSIGLLKRSEISPELSNVFSKMNVGGISEPLVTANGVYIFKLDGLCFKKNSETLKNYVRTIIEDEKFKKEYRLWIRSLRQRAYIEVMD